jgi:hypothetical protein
MPTAASAPNAKIRIAIVIGIESFSALPKSSLKALSIALLALAPPNSPTRSCGWAAATLLTASSIGAISSLVFLSSPLTSKFTRTDLPSGLIWLRWPALNGECTFCTVAKPETALTVSSTASRTSAAR